MSKKVDYGKRAATYDDLVSLPENMVGEIVDGELFASPRPAPRHAMAATALGGEIYGPFQMGRNGPGGWLLLVEPELHLGPDVLVPDLAGWRKERMPKLPDAAYFDLAPDWVCEVISPSTGRLDRVRKVRIYAREGIGHAWLVDPIQRSLEILRLENDRWTLASAHEEGERVRAEPFDAIELDLSALWSP